jgi:hypothetical protein
MFKVMLERNLNGVRSTITIGVRANNRDEAAAIAESDLIGWKVGQIESVR